jgi:type IV secretion system protein VirB6
MSQGIFTGLDNTVMSGLSTLVSTQATQYSSMMSALVGSTVTLFLLWRGYQTLAGRLNTPVGEVAWDVGRMLIILAFVTNASNYLNFVVGSIEDFKNGFGSGGAGDNIWVVLDTLWGEAQKLGSSLMELDQSTYVKTDGFFGQVLVWGGTMVVLAIATIVNLGAEITLLLMEATGPIFIFCLMYGFLHEMFNNWLKIIFTAILTLLFASVSIQMMINYFAKVLAAATASSAENNIVTLGAQCCLAGLGAAGVVWLSAKIAGSLAGASVQAAIQAATKAGGSSIGRKVASAASPTAKVAGGVAGGVSNALGSVGNMAARSREQTWGRVQASVSNMKSLNK